MTSAVREAKGHSALVRVGSGKEKNFGPGSKMMWVRQYFCLKCGETVYDNNKGDGYEI